jgi:hypothetical protein
MGFVSLALTLCFDLQEQVEQMSVQIVVRKTSVRTDLHHTIQNANSARHFFSY